MKEYSDSRKHAKPITVQQGDRVLIRQNKENKTTPIYDPTPYTVIHTKGSMATVMCGNHRVTRNVSLLKKIHAECGSRYILDDDSDDDIPQGTPNNDRDSIEGEEQLEDLAGLADDRQDKEDDTGPEESCDGEELQGPTKEGPRTSQRERRLPSHLRDYVTK